MRSKVKSSLMFFAILLLSLAVNIIDVPKVSAVDTNCPAIVEIKVQKMVNGEKPKPGEVFEFEITPDWIEDWTEEFDGLVAKTDEDGVATLLLYVQALFFPASVGDYHYTIKEINTPEGYTAMNDAHFTLSLSTDMDDEGFYILYINGELWAKLVEGPPECNKVFTFEATPNTINNVKDEETPVDPREETPTTEIKPPESGTLTRSFIAVAAILVLGFTIYRLSHRKSGKE